MKREPNEISIPEIREYYFQRYGEKICLVGEQVFINRFPEYEIEIRKRGEKRKFLIILTKDKKADLEYITNKIYLEYKTRKCKIPAEKVNLLIETNMKCFEQYPQSREIIKKYLLKFAEKTNKRIIGKITIRFSVCKIILQTIQKEITEIDESDIERIVSAIKNKESIRYLDELLSFMKKYYSKKMKHEITVTWNLSHLKTKIKKEFYSEEQWLNYTEFLIDINRHIENAFRNATYAEYWLCGLLHLSLAWRISDILAIPSLTMLPNVEIYTLDWFETHTFTLDMAMEIINQIEPSIATELVQKTGAKKIFTIIPNLAVPTAIAIVICERWRRERQNSKLFLSKSFGSYSFVKKMGDTMEGFENRKANRTLLSLLYKKALYVNQACTSYQFLPSVARSHKRNTMGVSQITSIYLEQSYDISKLESIPKQLMENGAFGYLYKTILKLCDDINYDTDSELEFGISLLKKELSPIELENYSGLLEKESRNRHNIINMLISCDKSKLQEKLIYICEGKATSKTHDMYCASYDKCKNPLLSSCVSCPYSIPTIHTLTLINTTIFKYIYQLEKLDEKHTIDRMRITYFIQKLILTIHEATQAFGKSVVASYVQFDEIKKALASVETKLLEVG